MIKTEREGYCQLRAPILLATSGTADVVGIRFRTAAGYYDQRT